MKVIFGIAILTAKDIDAMNARINKAADMAKENEQSVAQQDKALNSIFGQIRYGYGLHRPEPSAKKEA
jgi:hypothetical protein